MEVHKFKLGMHNDVQMIDAPKGGKILCLQWQDGKPCIWIEADPAAKMETRRFAFYGTGWELPEVREYIGTVQQGPYVWHLYEAKEADRG